MKTWDYPGLLLINPLLFIKVKNETGEMFKPFTGRNIRSLIIYAKHLHWYLVSYWRNILLWISTGRQQNRQGLNYGRAFALRTNPHTHEWLGLLLGTSGTNILTHLRQDRCSLRQVKGLAQGRNLQMSGSRLKPESFAFTSTYFWNFQTIQAFP